MKKLAPTDQPLRDYKDIYGSISDAIHSARNQLIRSVNVLMTVTYWEVGRKIIESQQEGDERAKYGSKLIEKLSSDLSKQFGRGFGADNLELMRLFYLTYPASKISESVIRKLEKALAPENSEALSRKFGKSPTQTGRIFSMP